MNIEELAKSLKPWMQVDTWSTTHPLDSERFHNALSSAKPSTKDDVLKDAIKKAEKFKAEMK